MCVGSVLVFVWYAIPYAHSSFAIIFTRKRELIALLLLSFGCLATVNVLWLFLAVPWVSLQYVIVIFPNITHFFKLVKQCNTKTIFKYAKGIIHTKPRNYIYIL